MEDMIKNSDQVKYELLFFKYKIIQIIQKIYYNIIYFVKRRNPIKIIVYLIFFISFIFFNIYLSKKDIKIKDLRPYKLYINNNKNHKRYFRKKMYNQYPYITVCLPALNMEKYIEQTLLSIINQSFQDFEIVVVNDNSKDNTENILKKMYLEDKRIKIITHSTNKGVYYSRVEAILNAKGIYIILMDPDDMFLNENLFMELFNYNLNYNLDIIEFTVYHQFEGRRNIIYPNNHLETHYHNFSKNIIYQPELSKILFQVPDKNNSYCRTICRNIWNKMIRKRIFLDMHEYIGVDYFNEFVITADDMLMNLISYHFANNYSNIDLPGYMYNLRGVSMSRGDGGIELKTIRSINHFLYFKNFYRYIKQFNINRKSLYYEMKNLKRFIFFFKDCNITSHQLELKNFLNEILNDEKANIRFKIFLSELLLYIEEDQKSNFLEKIIKFFKKN